MTDSSADQSSLAAAASKALNLAAEYSYGIMKDGDHWNGEVLDNSAITAYYVFLQQSVGHDFGTDPDTPALLQWLFSLQNPDGSWGIAPGCPGDASSTVLTYFALKILQVSKDDPAMVRAQKFAQKVGGVAAVNVFTRFILATFGLLPWTAVPQLPPEFILLPSILPLNVYNLSYWARATMIPMLVEPEGDWGGAVPPMYTSILALMLEGTSVSDPKIQKGIEAVERYGNKDSKGKRIQSVVSPVWDTVLMTVGLADSELGDKRVDRAIQWILKRQVLGPTGDWRIYNPTVPAGGWSFQYYNTWYPDTDDTAAAVLALVKTDAKCHLGSFSINRATMWLLGMQNRDGGWGAFDRENNKLFLNKIPLGDMNHLCDPSTEDVTGRILECFGLQFSSPYVKQISADLLMRMRASASRGIGYFEATQEKNGAWFGRWGSNYLYGTSNVLCSLPFFMDDPRVRRMVSKALTWLKAVQNSDGGWGETFDSYSSLEHAGKGPSTAAQTAWGVMALLAHLPPSDYNIKRGVAYLTAHQTNVGDGPGISWPDSCHFTAVGFPGFFWLDYGLYRHYFPMMALGRYVKACRHLQCEEKANGFELGGPEEEPWALPKD
ncbi:unnamed protein product [Calypogeia fissa]